MDEAEAGAAAGGWAEVVVVEVDVGEEKVARMSRRVEMEIMWKLNLWNDDDMFVISV